MDESACSSKCKTFKVGGIFPRGRPWKKWNEIIRSDLKEKVSKNITKDRNAWKTGIKMNMVTNANVCKCKI